MPEPKNILIAPNAFKGTLSATRVTDIIYRVLNDKLSGVILTKMPLADGGDGTLDVLYQKLKFDLISVDTFDPLGREIQASYGLSGNTAFIELAEASGIRFLSNKELDPTVANTYGTGVLIRDAINKGAKDIKIFCGGSASIDLGLGIIAALLEVDNYRFSNPIFNFSPLLDKINNFDDLFQDIDFKIYTDVRNPLLGPEGAVKTFGKQKGVEDSKADQFEEQIRKIVNLLNSETQTEGMGASGGITVIFDHLKNVSPEFAGDYIFKLLEVEDQIKRSDLIITGEGRFDQQSVTGKLAGEILKITKEENKKLIILSAIEGSFYPEGATVIVMEKYLNEEDKRSIDYSSQLEKAIKNYIKKHDW